jgi:hypothetical protein
MQQLLAKTCQVICNPSVFAPNLGAWSPRYCFLDLLRFAIKMRKHIPHAHTHLAPMEKYMKKMHNTSITR